MGTDLFSGIVTAIFYSIITFDYQESDSQSMDTECRKLIKI